MQKKCSRCGKDINQVGKLIKITWLGSRKPLCVECRKEVKKDKGKFKWKNLLNKLRRDKGNSKKKLK